MKAPLPADCTLWSLKGNLKDPKEFVRQVLGNMTGHQRDCQIRLALDCPALYPDYQVEFFIYDDVEGEEIAFAQTAAVFKGRGHREVTYDGTELNRPWSSKTMTFLEVQQLLGELRGILSS
ncbi:hypothetical protein [Sinorhizobium meliloti]|uniref:hypothetical protein n=1 Tax=Rhizobium meliloti TaxID=382 RepID=UPI000FDA90C3|nr:hypothetical protein [Sinorhizobium meliloti]MDW9358925.1 hypothetical protein [Sinorhizobium meliloti]MDW9486489.1 hypothetical protein [Sinorhizobium meliloti]MDW9590555.1 hypothetical protein [Sinorhizobium meliloti]MDW9606959.1 hypothetical protein [Sinorhizobium meliloti]MDW9658312.1 hypothetical protein [Sinorhizobium meliloti]